jgi:CheY-like chemotaxis protein
VKDPISVKESTMSHAGATTTQTNGHAAAAAPGIRSGQAPRTILVVDDFDEFREILADALRTAGYEVLTTRDPGYALFRLLGEPPVDLVLCDIRMPSLSGAQLYRMVKQRRPQLAERFVFMTGSALADRDKALLGDSTAPVLFKPIFRADLLQCVENFFGRPAATQA